MLKESSNNDNKNSYSETTNIAKEKLICKDGFCSLPNQKNISKQNKNTFSGTTNIGKEKIICKDGFCSLPNQKENLKQDTDNSNLFDPI